MRKTCRSSLLSIRFVPLFALPSPALPIESTITRGRIITAITDCGVTDCRNKHKSALLSGWTDGQRRNPRRFFALCAARDTGRGSGIEHGSSRAIDVCRGRLDVSVDELSLFFGESVVTITSSRFHSRSRAHRTQALTPSGIFRWEAPRFCYQVPSDLPRSQIFWHIKFSL